MCASNKVKNLGDFCISLQVMVAAIDLISWDRELLKSQTSLDQNCEFIFSNSQILNWKSNTENSVFQNCSWVTQKFYSEFEFWIWRILQRIETVGQEAQWRRRDPLHSALWHSEIQRAWEETSSRQRPDKSLKKMLRMGLQCVKWSKEN